MRPASAACPACAHAAGYAGQIVDRAFGEQERAFHDAPVHGARCPAWPG